MDWARFSRARSCAAEIGRGDRFAISLQYLKAVKGASALGRVTAGGGPGDEGGGWAPAGAQRETPSGGPLGPAGRPERGPQDSS
jgi:hypothetical protein